MPFMPLSLARGAFLHLWRGSHPFVFCMNGVRESLAKKLTTEESTVSRGSLFIGPIYILHAKGEGQGNYCLHQQTYLIIEDV